MPRRLQSFAHCLLTALLLTALVRAQTAAAPSTSDTIYHLHGTVVNGVTNRPVGRALVASADRRLATMTDGEGHFRIDVSVLPKPDASALPARSGIVTGSFARGGFRGNGLTLTAQHPGYLPGEQFTNLPLDDSLNTTDVVLKLMPSATLSGRVSAVGADGARNVRVTLLHHQVNDGVLTWSQAGSHQTSSTGEFHFTNLQPGEYCVMSAEWAGGEPLNVQRTAITRQYPPDFLGDTRSLAQAAKLHLHYGDDQHVELHLHQAIYYPVAIPIQNQPTNSPINVRLAGSDTFNGYQLGWNGRDNAVEGSLPSGSYKLQLTSFGQQQGSALVPLTVANQPLEHAPVTLAVGSRIPIRIHTEFTQQEKSAASVYSGQPQSQNLANLVQLYLRPLESDGSFGGSSVRHGEETEPALENVQPGTYFVRPNVSRGYISSMTAGGVDLLRHPLTVGDGGAADPIDVTLRDDSATLTGTVDIPANPSSSYILLLLVPSDGSGQTVQGYAQPDGKFTVQNVPPGSYRLFAFGGARMQQVPFRDSQAMHAYDGKGTAVSVSAGQNSTAKVSLTDVADVDKE